MPTIQPYQPGKLASPLVGVAGRSPQGEAQREHASELIRTKEDLERERGQELQDTSQLHGTELQDATEARGQILQSATALRGAQMAGQTQVAGEGIRGLGQVVGTGLELSGKRAYNAQQAQQQLDASHNKMLAQGQATAQVTAHDQAAAQKLNDIINGGAFADKPQELQASYQNLIQHNAQNPNGSYQFVDDAGHRLDSDYISDQAGNNKNDPDAQITEQKITDALAKIDKGHLDNLYGKAANQATQNVLNSVGKASTAMQSQILRSNATTLQGRLDDAFTAAQPVSQAISSNVTLFGHAATAANISDLTDKTYKAFFMSALNNPPEDPTAKLNWYSQLHTLATTGALPQEPPTVRGMMNARPDYPAMQLTDSEYKSLIPAIESRRDAAINEIKGQDYVNDGVNFGRASQLRGEISKYKNDPIYQAQARQTATEKINALQGEISQVQKDPRLPTELKESRIKSLTTQMNGFTSVLDKSDEFTHQVTSEAKADTREAKAEQKEANTQAMKDTTLTLDDHLNKFRELTSDPTSRGANMPVLQKQAVDLMKETTVARDAGHITEAQYQHYSSHAMSLIAAASIWTKNNPNWFQQVGKGWPGVNQPEAKQQEGQKAAALKANAWNVILTDLNKWTGEQHQFGINANVHNMTQDQQDRVTRAQFALSKSFGGAELSPAVKVGIVNKILAQTPPAEKQARTTPAHKADTKSGFIPPPPPTVPDTPPEDPAISELRSQNASLKAELDEIKAMLSQQQSAAQQQDQKKE